MTIGFLFAGQGQQFLHMGQDIADTYPSVSTLYAQAASILGYDVLTLSENQLNQTQYTQVAVYVLNAALQTVLKEKGIEPTAVLGLSLGEYNALRAAEVFDFEDGLRMIEKRAGIMASALEPNTTGMAACLKTDRDAVAKAIEGSGLAICNVNTPSQIVIGGRKEELDAMIPVLKERGIRMVIPLKMSIASHIYLLKDASQDLKDVLEGFTFKTPRLKFINNIDAAVQEDNFVDTLSRHISEKTELAKGIETMASLGVTQFIEIGPKGSLAKFTTEILGSDVDVQTVYDMASLEALNI